MALAGKLKPRGPWRWRVPRRPEGKRDARRKSSRNKNKMESHKSRPVPSDTPGAATIPMEGGGHDEEDDEDGGLCETAL